VTFTNLDGYFQLAFLIYHQLSKTFRKRKCLPYGARRGQALQWAVGCCQLTGHKPVWKGRESFSAQAGPRAGSRARPLFHPPPSSATNLLSAKQTLT